MTFGYTERCAGSFQTVWLLALFTNAQGHMTSKWPRSLAVRGWRAHNCSTICTIGTVASGARFLHLNKHVCQVYTTRVHFGEPVSARLKEENGGGLTSSSFGRLWCRKSPARGFWMWWIYWCHFHSHLKTSSASFSPLKFQEAPGNFQPSLMEDMVWWAYVCFLWLNNHFLANCYVLNTLG